MGFFGVLENTLRIFHQGGLERVMSTIRKSEFLTSGNTGNAVRNPSDFSGGRSSNYSLGAGSLKKACVKVVSKGTRSSTE